MRTASPPLVRSSYGSWSVPGAVPLLEAASMAAISSGLISLIMMSSLSADGSEVLIFSASSISMRRRRCFLASCAWGSNPGCASSWQPIFARVLCHWAVASWPLSREPSSSFTFLGRPGCTSSAPT